MSERELSTLAGVLYARGKVYASSPPRGREADTRRDVVSWAVELSQRPEQQWACLGRVFGVPTVRAYYGRTTWRFVLQSHSAIRDLAKTVEPFWPTGVMFPQAVAGLCAASSSAARAEFVAQIKALQS